MELGHDGSARHGMADVSFRAGGAQDKLVGPQGWIETEGVPEAAHGTVEVAGLQPAAQPIAPWSGSKHPIVKDVHDTGYSVTP
jgi:hypothetical protein